MVRSHAPTTPRYMEDGGPPSSLFDVLLAAATPFWYPRCSALDAHMSIIMFEPPISISINVVSIAVISIVVIIGSI